MKMTSDLTEEAVTRMAGEDPSRLVIMIYDVAIDGLRAAARAAEDGDIAARFDATTRAADAIEQLHGALDMENGGEIAQSLADLYVFIVGQLPMLNLHNDAALAEQLASLLVPLRQSWVELGDRIRNGEDVYQGDETMMPAPASEDDLPLIAAAG